jgi:YceI-like domain
VHSSISFMISHVGISNMHGRFNAFSGEITIDRADPTKSSFALSIPIKSIGQVDRLCVFRSALIHVTCDATGRQRDRESEVSVGFSILEIFLSRNVPYRVAKLRDMRPSPFVDLCFR